MGTDTGAVMITPAIAVAVRAPVPTAFRAATFRDLCVRATHTAEQALLEETSILDIMRGGPYNSLSCVCLVDPFRRTTNRKTMDGPYIR
jgi:hypothetical protein